MSEITHFDLQSALDQIVERFSRLSKGIEHVRFHIGAREADLLRYLDRQIEVGEIATNDASRYTADLLRENERLQTLAETAALLNSSLDLETVLKAVIDAIIHLTGAERALVILVENDQLNTNTARVRDHKTGMLTDTDYSTSIVSTVLQTRQPVLTVSAKDDTRFDDKKSVVNLGLRSVLCTPLISRDEIIGVIYTDNRATDGIFDQAKVELVNRFAVQAAVAITNARLFEQVNADLKRANQTVERLKIEIDEARRTKTVENIVETDYFRNLQAEARRMRQLYRDQSTEG